MHAGSTHRIRESHALGDESFGGQVAAIFLHLRHQPDQQRAARGHAVMLGNVSDGEGMAVNRGVLTGDIEDLIERWLAWVRRFVVRTTFRG